MTLPRSAAALILCLALSTLHAADSKKAKKLYDDAKAETDQSKQVQGICAAAAIDQKYQQECDTLRIPFVKRQDTRLAYAEDALSRKDFTTAKEFAHQAVPFNEDISTRKANLLSRIDAAEHASPAARTPSTRDQSGVYLARLESDFEKGDFNAAIADAQQITDASLKTVAVRRLSDINHYNTLLGQADKAEQQGDFAGARTLYLQAQQISSNGPGQISAHISALNEKMIHIAAAQVTVTPPNKATVPIHVAPDNHVEINGLLSAGHQAEQLLQWKQAQEKYNAVLRLDAANKEALGGLQRVQPRMAADPTEREKILKAAIRDFYHSGFESAQTSLQIYLNEQQVANRGAADFYLAATLLEKWIFETRSRNSTDVPKDVIRAFKRAREEGYKPLADYVSPSVMKVWNSSGM